MRGMFLSKVTLTRDDANPSWTVLPQAPSPGELEPVPFALRFAAQISAQGPPTSETFLPPPWTPLFPRVLTPSPLQGSARGCEEGRLRHSTPPPRPVEPSEAQGTVFCPEQLTGAAVLTAMSARRVANTGPHASREVEAAGDSVCDEVLLYFLPGFLQ